VLAVSEPSHLIYGSVLARQSNPRSIRASVARDDFLLDFDDFGELEIGQLLEIFEGLNEGEVVGCRRLSVSPIEDFFAGRYSRGLALGLKGEPRQLRHDLGRIFPRKLLGIFGRPIWHTGLPTAARRFG